MTQFFLWKYDSKQFLIFLLDPILRNKSCKTLMIYMSPISFRKLEHKNYIYLKIKFIENIASKQFCFLHGTIILKLIMYLDLTILLTRTLRNR